LPEKVALLFFIAQLTDTLAPKNLSRSIDILHSSKTINTEPSTPGEHHSIIPIRWCLINHARLIRGRVAGRWTGGYVPGKMYQSGVDNGAGVMCRGWGKLSQSVSVKRKDKSHWLHTLKQIRIHYKHTQTTQSPKGYCFHLHVLFGCVSVQFY